MKRNLFLAVLLLLSLNWGYGQQRTISGIVSDASTKEPLMGASVVSEYRYEREVLHCCRGR